MQYHFHAHQTPQYSELPGAKIRQEMLLKSIFTELLEEDFCQQCKQNL